LCKKQRQRAWLLIEELDKRRFMFSELGEFIPQGSTEPISGSDVRKILKYILMKAPDRGEEPLGFPEFIKQFMDR
jgi:hypothetical protein